MPDAPSFVDILHAETLDADLRKGERTRRRISWATAVELAAISFAELNMEAIARRAEVSRAALYQYVGSKEDAVRLVLTDFQARTLAIPAQSTQARSIREAIWRTNRYYIDYFARNAVFMERVRELRAVLPDLIAEKQRVNREWAAKVAAHVRRHSRETLPESSLTLRILALECMIDDVLRETFVIGNPDFAGAAADLDGLAEELTAIWHGVLYRET